MQVGRTGVITPVAVLAPVQKLTERGVNMTEVGSPVLATPVQDGARASLLPLQKPDGIPMTVVVTGAVPGPTRNEGNEAVETLGGKSSSSVSKRTDLVVLGDGAGTKADKAEHLGVRTLPADHFAALLQAHVSGDSDTIAKILAWPKRPADHNAHGSTQAMTLRRHRLWWPCPTVVR